MSDIKIEDCSHEKFNPGYLQICESGCGHPRLYIQGYYAASEAATLRRQQELESKAEGQSFPWVAVSDRNPDSDDWYWAMVETSPGCYEADKRRYAIEIYGSGFWISSAGPVIAWMPIPPFTPPSDTGQSAETEEL